MSRFYNTACDGLRILPRMDEKKTYEGSCHCGAVKFEITMAPPEKAFAGTCSICKRAGWLLAFGEGGAFKSISGDEAVRDYQFGNKKIHHFFCTTCGVRAYSRGVSAKGEPTVAVNLRCIPDLDVAKLPVETYDCAKL